MPVAVSPHVMLAIVIALVVVILTMVAILLMKLLTEETSADTETLEIERVDIWEGFEIARIKCPPVFPENAFRKNVSQDEQGVVAQQG